MSESSGYFDTVGYFRRWHKGKPQKWHRERLGDSMCGCLVSYRHGITQLRDRIELAQALPDGADVCHHLAKRLAKGIQ